MPRASRYGIAGLTRNPKTKNFEIDLRYRERGVTRRYRERIPAGCVLAAAKLRAQEVVNLAAVGKLDAGRQDERRLKSSLDEYIKWRETQARTSIRDARRAVDQLVEVVGDLPLSALTSLRLEAFKKARLAADAGPATVNRALALFFHFGKMAAAWGWMPREQALALRDCPKLREPPGRVRYVTADEKPRLVEATAKNKALYRIVVGLLLTGGRVGELIGLRVGHVDLAQATIRFVRTKNGRSRTVPLHPDLAPLLEIDDEKTREKPEAPVFTSRTGKAWTADGLRSSWGRAMKRAKIVDLHLHDLRHDHATRLRRKGASLELIRDLLGHSQIGITTRYAHVGRDELRAAVDGLDHVAPPMPAQATMRVVK